MTGLYRTEIFIPGCLNDGDEWFGTEADAIAYADRWAETEPLDLARPYFYPAKHPHETSWLVACGWASDAYRATVTYYTYYDWCPLCGANAYDTTERDECEVCWTYQCDAADRETE